MFLTYQICRVYVVLQFSRDFVSAWYNTNRKNLSRIGELLDDNLTFVNPRQLQSSQLGPKKLFLVSPTPSFYKTTFSFYDIMGAEAANMPPKLARSSSPINPADRAPRPAKVITPPGTKLLSVVRLLVS